MALDFTAIDFETANFQRGSVCAVGLTNVRDGEITDSTSWFIDPPTGLFFTNTHVHGIDESHVYGAPTWAESLEQIARAAAGKPLVAYSTFDKGVHNAANTTTGLTSSLDFIDMLAVARLHFSELENHKLTTVAEHIGLPAFEHHDPGADARAAAQIALALANERQAPSIETVWQEVLAHRAARKAARGRWSDYTRKDDLPDANPDADPTHPLHGHTVCFSGGLPGMSRDDARTLAAWHGASLSLSVTKSTTILVVGEFDPATLKPGAKFSSKVQKALTLAEKGQPIEIMTGAEFIATTEEGE